MCLCPQVVSIVALKLFWGLLVVVTWPGNERLDLITMAAMLMLEGCSGVLLLLDGSSKDAQSNALLLALLAVACPVLEMLYDTIVVGARPLGSHASAAHA